MENELIKANNDYPPAEISPLEEKIEFWRQRVSLFLGPLLAGALLLVPMPGLSPRAHTLAADYQLGGGLVDRRTGADPGQRHFRGCPLHSGRSG